MKFSLTKLCLHSNSRHFLILVMLLQLGGCKPKSNSDFDSELMGGFSPDSLLTLSETIFKIAPTTRSKDDCVIAGQHQVKSLGKLVEGHFEVELTSPVPGCKNSRTKGWIFKGHMIDPKKVATIVRRATLFNLEKKPVCMVEPSIVRMITEPLEDGDLVKFRPIPSFIDQLSDKCQKLATYYVSKSSFVKGVQAISLSRFATLKVKPAQAGDLTKGDAATLNSRVCSIPPGVYVLEKPITLEEAHYKLEFPVPLNEVDLPEPFNTGSEVLKNPEISKKIPGGKMACSFPSNKVAYLWPSQSDFADPEAKPVSMDSANGYFYPLEPGIDPAITSSWCQLRGIGTSPHIGTDFADFGGSFNSQAIFSGRIERIGFLESCGYEVYLADDRGALWRYLHCNKPNLVEGQKIKGGEMICTHSSYPLSGCGSGAHLHLDRFKIGVGYPPAKNAPHDGCNFDSQTPFEDRKKLNQ